MYSCHSHYEVMQICNLDFRLCFLTFLPSSCLEICPIEKAKQRRVRHQDYQLSWLSMFLCDFSQACFGLLNTTHPCCKSFAICIRSCKIWLLIISLLARFRVKFWGGTTLFCARPLSAFPSKHVSKLCLTYYFVASLAQIIAPGVHSSETQIISHIQLLSPPTVNWRANRPFWAFSRPSLSLKAVFLKFPLRSLSPEVLS